MERIRAPPEKYLLENIFEKSLEKIGLRLTEGEKRYWFKPAHGYGNISYDSDGICQKKTTENALKLKLHPLSKGNILYELIGIYNFNKNGRIPKDCIPSGKEIEVARFSAGLSWARIKLSYCNGSPNSLAELSTDGEFTAYIEDTMDKGLFEYEILEDYGGLARTDYWIQKDDLPFIVPACGNFIMDKYKSYIKSAKLRLSDSQV